MNSVPPIINEPVDGLLLFDAECPFCRRAVRWLLARERGDSRIAIAGLETPIGGCLGRHFQLDPSRCDSIWYVIDGQVYRDSEALWRLSERLDGAWRWLANMRRVPRPLRDSVYQWVGRHRSRLAPDDDARLEAHPRWRNQLSPALSRRLGLPDLQHFADS